MSKARYPDHDLDDRRILTKPAEIKALAHPIRDSILDLLLERSATVKELAAALGRAPSTVAFHVEVLHEAELVKVVRTRQVRAVTERTYGRTARIFTVGELEHGPVRNDPSDNPLTAAASDAAAAHAADRLRSITRRVRIDDERAGEFWQRVEALAAEFATIERTGDTMHTLVIALYATDHPALHQ